MTEATFITLRKTPCDLMTDDVKPQYTSSANQRTNWCDNFEQNKAKMKV